jgi:hypothetical protein
VEWKLKRRPEVNPGGALRLTATNADAAEQKAMILAGLGVICAGRAKLASRLEGGSRRNAVIAFLTAKYGFFYAGGTGLQACENELEGSLLGPDLPMKRSSDEGYQRL